MTEHGKLEIKIEYLQNEIANWQHCRNISPFDKSINFLEVELSLAKQQLEDISHD